MRKIIVAGLIAVCVLTGASGQTISGPAQVCTGQTENYTISITKPDGVWSAVGGTIVGTQTISAVTVQWSSTAGSGSVKYTYEGFAPPGQEKPIVTKTLNVTRNAFTAGAVSSATVCAGSSGSVTLTGNSHGVQKWQQSTNGGSSWQDVAGTSTTLNYTGLQQTTWYRAVINGTYCTVPSAHGVVTVQEPSLGGTMSGNVEAFGVSSGTVSVSGQRGTIQKWQYKTTDVWIDIANTASTYNYVNVQVPTYYRVQVKNGVCDAVFSDPTFINILEVPDVDLGTSTNLRPGQSTVFTADEGHARYEWFKDGGKVQDSTLNTYEVKRPGAYNVRVTSNGGAIYQTGDAIVTGQMQSTGTNSVITYQFRVPIADEDPNVYEYTPDDISISADFFDGLGRPMQKVMVGATPLRNDLVVPIAYDEFGRVVKDYLPYVPTGTNALFRTDALTEQSNTSLYGDDTVTFAQKRFEPSPLNRVLEQAAPGEAWKLESNGTGKTVKFSYEINSASDEVRLWKIASNQPASTGFYPAGRLYKNVTTDEDGNQSIEFTNKQGQTVLKRVMVDVVSADTTWADTYYVYDIYGMERVVWQPQGVAELKADNWAVTPARLKNWAFLKEYDGRNRMISKQVPGADTIYMVYDKWDRQVLTQDGNQRANNKWLFTKYDALNRPILTGIMTSTDDVATLRTTVMSTTQRYETFDDEGTEGYTNVTYPTTGIDHYLMVTYYDTYDFTLHAGGWTPVEWDYADPELTKTVNGHTYTTPITANTAVKGQVTGTKTRNLQTGEWLKTMQFYDDRYRTIQTITDNIRGERDRTAWLYDFTGQVLQELAAHNESDAPTNQNVLRQMTYDHGGRLTGVSHTLNDGEEVQLSAQAYNELSQMTAKTLMNGFETMNYVFNIRGWLTDIMSGVYTQQMFYNQTDNQLDNTPMFNGNISAIRWSDQMMVAANPTRAYQYDYDAMGRLKAANHFEGSTATNKFSSMYTYDLNGNIGTLKRYGDTANLIDDMVYDYTDSGNQLQHVTDAASDTTTFHDRNTEGVDYGYDANGNMILDKNKKIDTIYYNHLNIPTIVVMEPVAGKRDSLVYHHDAAGIKLRQDIYVNDSLIVKQEYAGDFYYENDTLKFINHEEGRVVVDMEAGLFDYQVNILDHLGNTRVTLSTTPKVYSFTATMEDANASSEEGIFQNITETRVSMAAANQTEGGIRAARIPNTDPIGPLTMLQVNKGDTVKLDAWAYYEGDGSTDGLISEAAILAALINSYGASTGTAEVSAGTQNELADGLDFPGNLLPKTNQTNDDAPKAFINYMQFDEQMTFITSGFVQISTAAQFSKEHVVLPPITIDRNGFVMAYISNESNQLNYVHFDDFTVTHSKTPVIYASSFEPFGLEFATFNRSFSQQVRYKFQEQEYDETTRWYAFKYRNHDPVLGRFFNIDPLAEKFYYNSPFAFSENKVTIGIELEGLEIFDGVKLATWIAKREIIKANNVESSQIIQNVLANDQGESQKSEINSMSDLSNEQNLQSAGQLSNVANNINENAKIAGNVIAEEGINIGKAVATGAGLTSAAPLVTVLASEVALDGADQIRQSQMEGKDSNDAGKEFLMNSATNVATSGATNLVKDVASKRTLFNGLNVKIFDIQSFVINSFIQYELNKESNGNK